MEIGCLQHFQMAEGHRLQDILFKNLFSVVMSVVAIYQGRLDLTNFEFQQREKPALEIAVIWLKENK